MTTSVNLSLISPSNIGNHASCTLKPVLDTDFPEKARTTNPQADFGTIGHYYTQYLLGCAPTKEPTQTQIDNARRCKEVKHCRTEADFSDHVIKCAKKAMSILPQLKPGVKWVSEVKCYNNQFLKDRINRAGDKVGFGGDIDLLASDASELWDLKFKGEIEDEISTEYLWQLASYHLIKKVPVTGIALVTRDAKVSGIARIDWRDPGMPELLERIVGFTEFLDNSSFRKYAWPIRGPQCKFCRHKPPDYWNPDNTSKCPLFKVPSILKNLDIRLPSEEENKFFKEMTAGVDQARIL